MKTMMEYFQMEEQTVPSAGFSPQPDPYESEYITKFANHQNLHQHQHQSQQHHHHHQQQQQQQQQQQSPPNYGPILSIVDDSNSYCNLADNFDLSLLEDTYDHDMATVPSPSSWSQSSASFEPNYWQQMSLYATSPSSNCGDYRAFSPDCIKPALSPVHPFSSGGGDNGYQNGGGSPLMSSRPQTPANNVVTLNTTSNNNGSGGNVICNTTTPTTTNTGKNNNNLTSVSEADRNLLLRQRLEDTTFQRKYNFKPLDLPTSSMMMGDAEPPTSVQEIGLATTPSSSSSSSSTTSENVGNTLELNQIEPVFSMWFEHVRSDIQNVCSTLGISPDPTQWSETDVQSWLAHTLSSLLGMMMPGGSDPGIVTSALRQFWNVDGRSLCSFNEEEFRLRLPMSGDRVFAHLELWKTLQNKNCSTHLPTTLSEVSFASNDDSVFDLEQLLLTPINSSASTTATTTNSAAATAGGSSSTESSTKTSSDNKIANSPTTQTPCSSSSSSTAVASPSSSSSLMETSARSPASSSTFSSPLGPELMNTDDDEEEEEEEVEKKPVVKSKGSGTNGPKSGAHIHLWQFLKELLASPQQHGSCIRWLDQSRGVFKIEDSVRVARLWGLRKNRPAMNYDKLSRSIRQYYRKGIMRKTERSQRLVYQFCHPYGL